MCILISKRRKFTKIPVNDLTDNQYGHLPTSLIYRPSYNIIMLRYGIFLGASMRYVVLALAILDIPSNVTLKLLLASMQNPKLKVFIFIIIIIIIIIIIRQDVSLSLRRNPSLHAFNNFLSFAM